MSKHANWENTHHFAVIILYNIWMLQIAEKFDFLKSIRTNRGMRQEIQINNYKDNLQTERTMRIITTIYQNNNNNNNKYLFIYVNSIAQHLRTRHIYSGLTENKDQTKLH